MSHSRPATQPVSAGSLLCLSLHSVPSSSWPLTWPKIGASSFFCRLSFSYLSLSSGQPLPSSETNPGCWVAFCFALASLPVSLVLFFVCLPNSANEPKVCAFFLTGHIQAVSDAAAAAPLSLPLPPRETDLDDSFSVCCCCRLPSLRPHHGVQSLIPRQTLLKKT